MYIPSAMTTVTQDPAGRYTLLAEKVRRIGEEQGPRHGIGRLVHLSICYMFLTMLWVLASLSERARAGTLPELAPAPSRTAAADRPADKVDPRVCQEQRHAEGSRVRAPADAGADHRGAAAAAPDSCAETTGSTRTSVRAACERWQVAAMARTGNTLHHRSPVFAVLSEATGRTNRAVRKNRFAMAGRICVDFVTI